MERALLVTVNFGPERGWTAEERSRELRELALSAEADVRGEVVVNRRTPTPNCFVGKGKADDLGCLCRDRRIDVVIFNNDLAASQQRNLEQIVQTKTIDRTQLILDIFARRARSVEGKIQVELAQLLYNLPRLSGKGIMLSRLGGGIGTRGPGEQKLEVDRRRIRTRIQRLKRDLEKLGGRRSRMRKQRTRVASLTIAIIGYTNVGKSTLLNALTHSDVLTEDKLFATLDPTVRKFVLPNGQKVLFVDTVGFLQDLPHHLIEAFKATLEEVTEADLILHLIDASHPKRREQAEAVAGLLVELGARDAPVIPVLNKADAVREAGVVQEAARCLDGPAVISAKTRQGLPDLIARVQEHAERSLVPVELRFPAADARLLNFLHEGGIVDAKRYEGDEVEVHARVTTRIKRILDTRNRPPPEWEVE